MLKESSNFKESSIIEEYDDLNEVPSIEELESLDNVGERLKLIRSKHTIKALCYHWEISPYRFKKFYDKYVECDNVIEPPSDVVIKCIDKDLKEPVICSKDIKATNPNNTISVNMDGEIPFTSEELQELNEFYSIIDNIPSINNLKSLDKPKQRLALIMNLIPSKKLFDYWNKSFKSELKRELIENEKRESEIYELYKGDIAATSTYVTTDDYGKNVYVQGYKSFLVKKCKKLAEGIPKGAKEVEFEPPQFRYLESNYGSLYFIPNSLEELVKLDNVGSRLQIMRKNYTLPQLIRHMNTSLIKFGKVYKKYVGMSYKEDNSPLYVETFSDEKVAELMDYYKELKNVPYYKIPGKNEAERGQYIEIISYLHDPYYLCKRWDLAEKDWNKFYKEHVGCDYVRFRFPRQE